MQFETVADFLNMGNHGLYVWLSYALAFVILALNIVVPLLQKKKIIASLQRRLIHERKRK